MGIQEREYMKRRESSGGLPSGSSSSTFSIVGIVLIAVVVLVVIRTIEDDSSSPYFTSSETQAEALVEEVRQLTKMRSRHEKLTEISPLNINTASYDQLRLLPRITDAMASGIISERPIEEFEQLDDVYGIGPKTLELIRPHVVVEPTK